MVIRIKKRKKSVREHGQNTYGRGARKKGKGSGHHGGPGMSGSGKRADHKKSLVIKLYGNKYFGKQGITSKSTKMKKEKFINLSDIQINSEKLLKEFGKGKNELVFKNHKVLGNGEIKLKLTITAKGFTKSAINKIEKAGGKAIVLQSEKKKLKQEDIKQKSANKEEKKLIKK